MNKQIKQQKVLVEFRNVKKVFGSGKNKITALKNLSFKIFQGQNVSLIGANGAGKTTTVEMIMGINEPTSGRIFYPLSKNKKQMKKDFGIQFQDSTYPSFLYVKDIVNFIIKSYNIKIAEQELEKMVKMFKVESFYNHKASSLSGGQSQRLNILLSLLHKPKLVILDELSTGLDIVVRNEFKKMIKQYAKEQGITIVLISHDANEIMTLADRIIILKKGEIYKDVLVKQFKNANEIEDFIESNIV
ncbi:MAG: ABC transporter ATP-binding protein [Mycoplasmataceae bacterium]|jgi:ABC-2 type transport system ATP-binding protein|nr:ABC transporter ATP-binding protein [Mycoplasmataceae bacterium]